MTTSEPTGAPSKRNGGTVPWRTRRRIVFATLLFCAAVVGRFAFFDHADTRVGEALVTGAFLLAGMVVGSYVFGATWETIAMPTSSRARYYEDPNNY